MDLDDGTLPLEQIPHSFGPAVRNWVDRELQQAIISTGPIISDKKET
jgi:hypothetical protein